MRVSIREIHSLRGEFKKTLLYLNLPLRGTVGAIDSFNYVKLHLIKGTGEITHVAS